MKTALSLLSLKLLPSGRLLARDHRAAPTRCGGGRPRWPHFLSACALLAGLAMGPQSALAGEWPQRTVRIITPFSPGISVDVAARALAESLARQWKQSVIVEDRPGADTIVGTQAFVNARDDHTLLFTSHSSFTVIPLLRANIPYDPVAGVSPISLAVEDFLCLVTAPKLGVGSLSEFVDLARAQPTKLNFYSVPGSPYLAYLAFQKRAGIATTFVSYNNPVNAVTDLAQDRIQIAVMPLASVLGAVQAGQIKLLAVTNAYHAPAAPEAPTVAESGFPDFTFGGFLGLFGPKDMPARLRERIASQVRIALEEPEVQQRLTNVGLIKRGTTPAEFAAVLDTQRAKWSAIARENNIKPE